MKEVRAPFAVDENGRGKALIFDADLKNESDVKFAKHLETVSKSNPKNLEEFICRLVEEEKKNSKNIE
jgi:hypothetical protein